MIQVADQPGRSPTPILMGAICWDTEMEADVWRALTKFAEMMQPPLRIVGLWRDLPAAPPALPWIAVLLTPFAASADSRDLQVIASFEQVLALAAIEHARISAQ